MFLKEQEKVRKEQEYKRSIQRVDGSGALVKEMKEHNIPFECLCDMYSLEEAKLNKILNEKTYFNVRVIGRQKLVSLAPEGRKLKKYLEGLNANYR